MAPIARLLPHTTALMGLQCEPQLLKHFLPDDFPRSHNNVYLLRRKNTSCSIIFSFGLFFSNNVCKCIGRRTNHGSHSLCVWAFSCSSVRFVLMTSNGMEINHLQAIDITKLWFCFHLHRFAPIMGRIPVYPMVTLIRIYPSVFRKFSFYKTISTISANEEVLNWDFCLSVYLDLRFYFFFFFPDKSNAKLPKA